MDSIAMESSSSNSWVVDGSSVEGRRRMAEGSASTSGDSLMDNEDYFSDLKCGVCGRLVSQPVHAPCGHSFCQTHLSVDGNAWTKLEQQAAHLHQLSIVHGFPVKRAREALAEVSDGDLVQAKKVCAETSRLEGFAVRVKPEIKEPRYLWGLVSHSSIGVVMKEVDDQVWVSFPELHNWWHCLSKEIEIEPIANKVREGVKVKIRAGCVPRKGLEGMGGDSVGTVCHREGCSITLLSPSGQWCGYIDEVEVFDADGSHASKSRDESVRDALRRLEEGKYSPSSLAHLAAFFRGVSESRSKPRLAIVVQGEQQSALQFVHGAVDLIRTVGLKPTRCDIHRKIDVFEPVDEQGGSEVVQQCCDAAANVAQELERFFGPLPIVPHSEPNLYRTTINVDPKFSTMKPPCKDLYIKSLRSEIVPAMAPQGEFWSWYQRGWTNEAEMWKSFEEGSSKATIARLQVRAEAEKIAHRLNAQGMKAEVVQDSLALEAATVSKSVSWVGEFPYCARVRFKRVPDDAPSSVNLDVVGIVVSQAFVQCANNAVLEEGDVVVGNSKLHYRVQLPKSNFQNWVAASLLVKAQDADRILPGVKVRVSPGAGRDPTFGWGQLQSSDVGVVHRVSVSGIVEVFFPSQENLWRGSLQDVTTEGLPEPVRNDCPVCRAPFPSGQRLSTDLAVEAQVRHLQNLFDNGSTPKSIQENNVVMRTKSHMDELKCNICFDLLVCPVTLPCGHSYCKHHIQVWLSKNDICPVCRVRVCVSQETPKPVSNQSAGSMIEFVIEKEAGTRTGLRGALAQLQQGALAQSTRPVSKVLVKANTMLENQLLRFFPSELKARRAEIADEIWDIVEKKLDGALDRLRAYLMQFNEETVGFLLDAGMPGADAMIPGMNGSLLVLACELGLAGVVKELLARGANPGRIAPAPWDFNASTLQVAAWAGSVDVLKLLLEACPWAEKRYADAMGTAIDQGHLECVRLFLGREGCPEFRNSMGFTPLLAAVRANNCEIVDILLGEGADIEARTRMSVLMVKDAGLSKVNGTYRVVGELNGRPMYGNARGAVIFCDEWWKLVPSVDDTTGRDSGDRYCSPSPHADSMEPPSNCYWEMHCSRLPLPAPNVLRLSHHTRRANAFLLAAQMGAASVMRTLLAANANTESTLGETKWTALHILAFTGNRTCLEVLLSARSPLAPAPLDVEGLTPLHIACHFGHVEIVSALLEAHLPDSLADPDSKAILSPLCLAAGCGLAPNTTALSTERYLGDEPRYFEIVLKLLQANTSGVGIDDGVMSLHAAVQAAASTIVEELLQKGISFTTADLNGSPPLLMAMYEGHTQGSVKPMEAREPSPQSRVVHALLETNASVNTARADNGMTALMAASCLSDIKLLKKLLGGGADVSATCRIGSVEGEGVLLALTGDEGPAWKVFDYLLRRYGAEHVLPGRPHCPAGHPLQRLTPKRCVRKSICDGCKAPNLHLKHIYWTCWDCDHDLCYNCSHVTPILRLPSGAKFDEQGEFQLHSAPECVLDPEDAFFRDEMEKALRSGAITQVVLNGWTALHFAIVSGQRLAAAHLFVAKADPCVADAVGMTPLHWASLLGRYACLELLLDNEANPEMTDSQGRVPLSLLPVEALRYAYASYESTSQEVQSHSFHVVGSGIADGAFSVVQKLQSRPDGVSQFLGSTGLPSVFSEAFRNSPNETEAASDGDVAGTDGGLKRPIYQRSDGAPYCIRWEERSDGWVMGQMLSPEHRVPIFKCSSSHSSRCPMEGWERVESADAADTPRPVMRILEDLPWRAGKALLAFTPEKFWLPEQRQEVEALAPWKPAEISQAVCRLTCSNGVTISLPTAMLRAAMPASVLSTAAGNGREHRCPMQ